MAPPCSWALHLNIILLNLGDRRNEAPTAQDLGTIVQLPESELLVLFLASLVMSGREMIARICIWKGERERAARNAAAAPPPQAAHIISNIQGMDMESPSFAHMMPTHKQPMRHQPSSGTWHGSLQHWGFMYWRGLPYMTFAILFWFYDLLPSLLRICNWFIM